MGKIISVHSYRGGTGKSNITANLAYSLVQNNQRVAVVDTDIQSPGIHVIFQVNRNLQIDLHHKTEVSRLDEYLSKMERLRLAVDQMGIHAIDTLWVLYSGGVPSKYLETILSLPTPVYRFYGLQRVTGTDLRSKFCLSDRYSPVDGFSDLQSLLEDREYEFYPAMQQVGMHLFLNALASGENKKIVIAEDGGYLAPLVNRLVLEKRTVGEVFQQYGFSCDLLSDEVKSNLLGQWIAPLYQGSVEHTRNGYDALMKVKNDYSCLAFPACSLAISRFKVFDESIEVAYSCLHAIESILW